MTYTEALDALEAFVPRNALEENFRQAGILALKDLEQRVAAYYAARPKAPPGYTVYGRNVEEDYDHIVAFYTLRTPAHRRSW
ncbi:MAG: hypothetical protein KGL39_15570 [Patescibacteria group bacterium]|nr:hypothetical protein [Patescibacteria group bacterium]